ncbi:MAG: hypothetical protein ACE5IG_01495 [Dehalococcoidia bacterium]
MGNAELVVLKNGHPATRDNCAVCGTRVFRLGAGNRRELSVRPHRCPHLPA